MDNAAQLKHALDSFYGGDAPRFQRMFPKLHYTAGFACFMEHAGAGAHWLFQILATQPEVLEGVKREGFGCVKLQVEADTTAVLTVDDGNDNVFYRRAITYTDCPVLVGDNGAVEAWTFFIEPYDERGTLLVMLPQER